MVPRLVNLMQNLFSSQQTLVCFTAISMDKKGFYAPYKKFFLGMQIVFKFKKAPCLDSNPQLEVEDHLVWSSFPQLQGYPKKGGDDPWPLYIHGDRFS